MRNLCKNIAIMKILKYYFCVSFFIIGFFLLAKTSFASEGTVELRSTTDKDYRCFAASLLMENASYRVIVSCRDLIYPPQPDLFTYIIWATPLDGGNPVKFGELGIGKASFETKEAFSNLFVTTERNRGARRPEGQVVMRGTVESISFLDRPTTPTPTPSVPEGEKEPAQEELTTGQKLALALKRAGLVIFLALAATVGLVFILTRPKR